MDIHPDSAARAGQAPAEWSITRWEVERTRTGWGPMNIHPWYAAALPLANDAALIVARGPLSRCRGQASALPANEAAPSRDLVREAMRQAASGMAGYLPGQRRPGPAAAGVSRGSGDTPSAGDSSQARTAPESALPAASGPPATSGPPALLRAAVASGDPGLSQ